MVLVLEIWQTRGFQYKGATCSLVQARVLLQERETTGKDVVWITEGTSLVRCAAQHLLSLFESNKRLFSITDTKAINFQDLGRRLPHSTFLDLTTQTDALDDAW